MRIGQRLPEAEMRECEVIPCRALSEARPFDNRHDPNVISPTSWVPVYELSAKSIASRTCFSFSGESVVMSEPIFPFDTVWI